MTVVTLPNEIVNKILMYRIQHPIANIIKPLILQYNEYNEGFDNDDNITFRYYISDVNSDYLYETMNLKIRRKNKIGRLRCFQCGHWFELYDIYYSNPEKKSVYCLNC